MRNTGHRYATEWLKYRIWFSTLQYELVDLPEDSVARSNATMFGNPLPSAGVHLVSDLAGQRQKIERRFSDHGIYTVGLHPLDYCIRRFVGCLRGLGFDWDIYYDCRLTYRADCGSETAL